MSDQAKPAMSEDDIETMAWELETKMMEIRKDPRAALAAGLARIRATMLAEYKADMAKRKADLDTEFAAQMAGMAKRKADLAAEMAKREAEFEAKLEALLAVATAEFRAALAERLRQHNAAPAAEPNAGARALQ